MGMLVVRALLTIVVFAVVDIFFKRLRGFWSYLMLFIILLFGLVMIEYVIFDPEVRDEHYIEETFR